MVFWTTLLQATGAYAQTTSTTASAIAYKDGTASSGYSGQGYASIARPAGVAVGDQMFVNVSTNAANDTYTPPAGWTLVTDGATPASDAVYKTMRLYSKVLTSTDTASYVWKVGPAQGYSVVLMAFSGVGSVTAVKTASSKFASAPPPISIAAQQNGSLLYFWSNTQPHATGTAPSGMTLSAAIATGGSGQDYSSSFGAYANGLASGNYNLKGGITGSTAVVTMAIALVPGGTASATGTAGSLALSSSSYTVAQTGGSLTVSVNRANGSTGAVSVAYSTANGTAIAGTDYTAASGTLSWASGDTAAKSFSIPVSNTTPFSGSKSFTINLANAAGGATLGSPSSATATINGSGTAGSLALSASSYTVAQTAGSLTVSVNRSGGSSGAVSVAYSTANGTAIAGTDYTAASGTLSWASGDVAAKSFTIPVSNTTSFSGSKSFTINLGNAAGGATLGSPASATASITGSGSPGSLAFSSSSYSVAQSAGSVTISVSRTNGSTGAVSVSYAAVNGSALAGADYTATSGTLSWASGDATAKTFSVPVSNSSPYTGSKNFTVNLSNATGGATLGSPSSATVTISGSAVPGTLALSATSYTVAQSAGSVTISVTRTGGSSGSASVNYAATNGSALAGADYTATSGTLSWASGDAATKSFSVAISNASPYSGTKNFTVGLSNASGATLGSPSSASVTINGSATGTGMGATAAARLLTQATFGPTIATVDAVSTQSYDQWFSAQVAATPSLTLPSVPNKDTNWIPVWWKNVVQGPDQLRQRMAFALSEIFVVSNQAAALNYNNLAAANYYDLLTQNAFVNYRTLLERITLNPEMGLYLNMWRSDKANPTLGTHADQNYAREIMQLFSVGLVQLNLDGTPKLDGNGNPIPTYGYNEIEGLSNTLTGWASAPVSHTGEQAWLYDVDYINPMVAYDTHHDSNAKTILGGVTIPAGGTAASDLKLALDAIYNHPNVGPFIGKQLIEKMVTSNPSPAYVSRVASVFNNNGSGVRGDMLAVVRAVLTDPEAVTPGGNTYGKMREPIIKLAGLWRAFGAADSAGGENEYLVVQDASKMFAQAPINAPTVFNFFQPDYQRAGPLQDAGLVAPEFQILNENTLVLTANQMQRQAYQFTDSSGTTFQGYQGYPENTGSVNLRTAAWEPMADTPSTLIDKLNQVLMLGQMPSAMRTSLINYISGIPTSETAYRGKRVVEATDLILNSPQYAIQR